MESALISSSSTATERLAKVFADYRPKSPPPHPGYGWTRFVCISDTHSRLFPVPDGDVLLHSGDLSSWGYPEQVEVTLRWLQGLSHPVKVVIGGNHDLCLDASLVQRDQVLLLEDPLLQDIRKRVRSTEVRDANVYYLQHESLKITTSEGRVWTVYGSPSTPRYARGAFQYDSAEEACSAFNYNMHCKLFEPYDTKPSEEIYQQIPLDTEILLTHTPPHLILDNTRKGTNAGCPCLAARMEELSQCRLHVFGHIHEAWGAKMSQEAGQRVSVNAAVDRRGSQAIIVDLRN